MRSSFLRIDLLLRWPAASQSCWALAVILISCDVTADELPSLADYPAKILERLEALPKDNYSDTMRSALDKVERELLAIEDLDIITPSAGPMPARVEPPPEYSVRTLTIGKIIAGPANIRADATIKSNRIGLLAVGESVEIVNRYNEWYEIKIPGNRLGFVYHELIEVDDEELLQPTAGLTAALPDAADELARAAGEEFGTSAFRCRNDLELCRGRFGYLDCELAMIACVLNVMVGGS